MKIPTRRLSGASRPISWITAVAISLFVGSAIAQQNGDNPSQTFEPCQCKGVMSPTQVANAFWGEFRSELDSNPDDIDQVVIVSKYLQLINLDTENMPEDRLDRLAIAEGAFLTFQVQITHDYFATLLEDDDLVSRHAWDRMMQIQYRALRDTVEARMMMEQFYEKFPPSEMDIRGRYQQINNFATQYFRTGRDEDAISLIVEEIQDIPTIAPFLSWSLPIRYSNEINASPRRREIRLLVAEKLAGLKCLSQRWAQESFPASDDPILRGDMPEWYWLAQNIRPGESLRSGRQRQLEDTISSLEEWLEGSEETSVISDLEENYRKLSYYSDTTTSVLTAESTAGDTIQNESRYRFVFDDKRGAVVNNYLGQMFLISNWDTVTNWFKAPARYAVSPFNANEDWRRQFFPVGGMMDTEHPAMAMLLDRRTDLSDGALPTVRKIDRVSNIEYRGKPTTLVEGGFFFSTQGINFDRSDETPVPTTLWIDSGTGFLRRAEYDITKPYSKSFGEVRKATLTVTHDDIGVDVPLEEELSQFFTFTPRKTDVERELAEIFAAPALNQEDDGSPNYLLNRLAPLFDSKTLDGEKLSLAELRGKRVVLFFWGTWCPNSARAMGQMEQLSKSDIKNVEVVGVNVDSFVGRESLQDYYATRGLSFTSIVDSENLVTSMYRGVFTPTTFVIDSGGIVRLVDIGETENLVQHYINVLRDTD